MKASNVFWGTLLILTGCYFFIDNIIGINLDFSFIFDYWPLLLVIWGLSILKIPQLAKNGLNALTALLVLLMLLGVFTEVKDFDIHDHKIDLNIENHDDVGYERIESENLSLPFDTTIKSATLNFSGGAGEFKIGGSTSDLINIDASSSESSLDYNIEGADNSADIRFRFDSDRKIINNWSGSREAGIKLNLNPDWNIDVKIGAGEFKSDLSLFKIKALSLKSGAADVFLKLGANLPETNLKVTAGASNIEILVPENAACEIHSNSTLSNTEFPGFKKNKGKYYSENYDSSKRKIIIELDGGVSNFEVRTY